MSQVRQNGILKALKLSTLYLYSVPEEIRVLSQIFVPARKY